jgi:flavin reductase (DIM6/NTAB) family NADH-FMN oxidoreductase RutF
VAKQEFAGSILSPLPLVLVGANVSGHPNYLTIGYIAPLELAKQVIFPIHRTRYTGLGILENGTFSVNIPSVDLLPLVKRCGSASGRDIDKSALFDNFYGELKTAPMIRECPLNMECEVLEIVTTKQSHNVVGRVVKSYVNEELVVNGSIAMQDAGLMSWTAAGDINVYALGELVDTLRRKTEAK